MEGHDHQHTQGHSDPGLKEDHAEWLVEVMTLAVLRLRLADLAASTRDPCLSHPVALFSPG